MKSGKNAAPKNFRVAFFEDLLSAFLVHALVLLFRAWGCAFSLGKF